MDSEVAFETGPFALSQEILEKACNYLELANDKSKTELKVIGPNQIQIIRPESMDHNQIKDRNQMNLNKVIAEFCATPKGYSKAWKKL